MLDIAEELTRWAARGRRFAVATVVAVSGSAPRGPGAALAVDADGTVIGSVSGGCVEAAVYELCAEVLRGGEPVMERFGYADDDAFAVGLTCGGVIDIFVQRVDPALPLSLGTGPVALARVVGGPAGLLGGWMTVTPDGRYEGGFGDRELDAAVRAEADAMLAVGRTGTVEVGADGGLCGEPVTLLVESSLPPPRMLVFGAVDFAASLVRVGAFLGYRVTVCDARPVFATRARFPDADEVVVDWPHRYLDSQRLDGRAVVCVLTHDAKFDVPLLVRALRMPVGYVGAMGSRRTHVERLARLREAGLTERELAALHSPIGLDLGARTPQETALSIAADITAHRHGGSGRPLAGAHTPIHHDRVPSPAATGSPVPAADRRVVVDTGGRRLHRLP